MDASDLSFHLRPDSAFLDDISTHWPQIDDPVKFVMRYGKAIQRYIAAILRNTSDADDACQDFLVRFFERGFQQADITRGRFRDYLKAAARNAALTRLRQRTLESLENEHLQNIPDASEDLLREADELWATEWRTAILERVWLSLEQYEKQTPESLYHTVLRLVANQPAADSATLAEQVSQKISKPYRADAFRKQVSRARRMFAQLIVNEIRLTLNSPIADQIEDELRDLNLLKYVRDFLPPDWRQTGLIA